MIWNLLPKTESGLYEYTYDAALKNIGSRFNIEYHEPKITSLDHLVNFTFDLPQYDSPIIFFAYHPNFKQRWREIIHEKCPNAKIIMTGGDTIYYGVEEVKTTPCDVFIETISFIVNKLNAAFPSEFIYWTISETIKSELKTNHIDNSLICLCGQTPIRKEFFDSLGRIGYDINYGLSEFNLDKMYELYSKSKFTIGNTMPAPGFRHHTLRSMKGMRDWFGPACDSLLICDDYPDIKKIGQDILPTYKYRDYKHLSNILNRFNNDDELYSYTLNNQKQWLASHTMEKQLTAILQKYGLI